MSSRPEYIKLSSWSVCKGHLGSHLGSRDEGVYKMGLKVVVTGASSGIGQATALTFSKDGHEVYATGRSESKLAETARQSKEAGGAEMFTGIGDVGLEADVNKNYAEAVKGLGGDPDVLVLNAASGGPIPLEQITNQDYDETFNANVRGVFLWLKAALPAFKKRGSGQIVIVNSILGEEVLFPNLSLYVATKFALTGLAKALRLELQGSGIKVASIYPGAVYTPGYVKSGKAMGIPEPDKDVLSPYEIASSITSIAYQSSRSDVEKITVLNAQKASH